MNARSLFVSALLFGSLFGCGQTAANTQVMVTVDAETGVRGVAQLVLVRVYGGPRGAAQPDLRLVQDYPIAVPPYNGWPLVIALAPLDRDPTRIYRVEALAYDVPDHDIMPAPVPVATVRAISGYVAGQTVLLRLVLQDSCLGLPCEEITETCEGGACVSADVDETMLPLFGDAGPLPDAYRPTDDARVDAGSDGGAGCTAAGCDDGLSCTNDFCTVDDCDHMARDSMCDDGNPCTDDRCDGSVGDGCTRVANTAACDDAEFCNGMDTCAGSSCSAHAGPPCGMLTCEEATDACTGCSAIDPCPLPTYGAYSSCVHAEFCSESGTQSRIVRTSTCNTTSMRCEYVDAPEASSCMPRVTSGMPCMAPTCDAAGACVFVDACDVLGSAPRTCRAFVCASGVCGGMDYLDPVDCPRSTEGNTCDDANPCTSADECSAGLCSGSPSCDGGTDAGMDADPIDSGQDAYSAPEAGSGADAFEMTVGDSASAGPRLVINEIDYDQPDPDDAEFVEIYNAGAAPQILAGIALVFVDGTTDTEYARATLSGTLNPLQYLVVGPSSSSVPRTFTMTGSTDIRNDTAAVVLWDTGGRRVIDALSYEGDVGPAVILAPGGASDVDVLEGAASPSRDDGLAPPLSMCRMPNGVDTDARSFDWTGCVPTPLAPNF